MPVTPKALARNGVFTVSTDRRRGRPRKTAVTEATEAPAKRLAILVPVQPPPPPPMTYVGAFRRVSKEQRAAVVVHVERFRRLLKAGRLRPRPLSADELAIIRELEGL